jgi:hypothetical protein
MTEHDPLERELTMLQPHKLSTLARNRIAERLSLLPLDKPQAAGRSIWTRRGALALGALAASMAVVILWPGDARRDRRNPRVEELEFDLATTFDPSLPSVWSYQRALIESPQALEGLFDHHSLRSLPVNEEGARPVVLARFVFFTNPKSGEL